MGVTRYCSASMVYFVFDHFFSRECRAACTLPQGHEGNHLAIVDGKPRAFPRAI